MNRWLLVSTLCVLAFSLGGAAPAAASGGWIAAADFAVGGAHFSFGYHQPGYGYPVPQPVYAYRVDRPLPYGGVRCTTACYVRDRHYYHHASCPLVSHYFQRYDYRPAWWGYRGPVAYYHSYPPRPYYNYNWRDRRGRDDDHRHRGHGWGHSKHHRHHGGCDHDD